MRSQRPGSPSRSVRQMINGTTNCDTMFGCPLACDTMAGANAQKPAPSHAGPRLPIRTRESRKYQAVAVAIMPSGEKDQE